MPDATIAPVETKTKKKSKKFLWLGLGCFTILFLFAISSVAAFFLFISEDSSINILSDDYKADNPQEELEMAFSDSVKLYLEDLDFSNFDKDNPPKIFDLDAISEKSSEISDNLRYFSSEDVDVSGKTLEVAFDMALDMGDSGSLNLNSDILVDYPEFDYSKYEVSEGENPFIDMSEAEILRSIPAINIKGSFNFSEPSTGEFNGNFDLTYTDEVVYISFDNLVMPESTDSDSALGAALVEDKVFKVDLTEYMSELISTLKSEEMSVSGASFSTEDLLEEYTNSLDETFADLSDEDEALIQRIGNPVKDVLIKTMEDFTIFGNTESFDPIRDDSDSTCDSSEVDFKGMIDQLETAAVEISDIVTNDEAYDGPETPEEARQSIEESMDQLRDEIDNSQIAVSVNMCVNDSKLSGAGVDLVFNSGSLDGAYPGLSFGDSLINLKFNYLILSNDSDKEVVAPEFDVDLTEQLNQIDPYSFLDMGDYGLDDNSTDDFNWEDYMDDSDYNFDEYMEDYNWEDYYEDDGSL